jgi:LuxR family maltose regulon positive regulatory protein
MKALGQSLRLAAPEGYVRIYLDQGTAAARLLAAFCQDQTHPAELQRYARTVLDAFDPHVRGEKGQSLTASPAAARSRALVEPLTQRETQVLHLLTTDLSSPEIADELIIAVSTVRSHIKNIYRKLDVHSRFEAIHQAATLQLV